MEAVTPDERHMRRALELAARARGDTAPNPMVGAVVVDSAGRPVGEGWHVAAGEPHAEIVALAQAGAAARGGTLYVTLEPCSHQGRTPPCAPAVVESGVARVVVAQTDPDEKVSGRGVGMLEAAGVAVTVGVCREQAERQLAAYRHHRRTGRPLVVLKLAITIDGATAAPDGTSQWITGPEARIDAHELRRESDAVLVGSGTVLADDPQLTVRTDPPPRRQPLRVVADARGRTSADAAVHRPDGRTIVATTELSSGARRKAWRREGAEVLVLRPGREGGVDVGALVAELGERGVLQVMVEGGAELAGELLRGGHVDRLVVYVGAATAGGGDARAALGGPSAATISQFARWRLDGVTRIGDDVRLDYHPA